MQLFLLNMSTGIMGGIYQWKYQEFLLVDMVRLFLTENIKNKKLGCLKMQLHSNKTEGFTLVYLAFAWNTYVSLCLSSSFI